MFKQGKHHHQTFLASSMALYFISATSVRAVKTKGMTLWSNTGSWKLMKIFDVTSAEMLTDEMIMFINDISFNITMLYLWYIYDFNLQWFPHIGCLVPWNLSEDYKMCG